MERTYEFELMGKQHKFLYTPAVMFDAMDKYNLSIVEILDLPGKEKAEAICYLADKMAAEAGSSETYDDKQYTPIEILNLGTAVMRAMERGNHRDKPPQSVSKTLQKIQKKKVRALLARIFLWLLLRALGYHSTKRTKRHLESSTT